MIQDINLDSGAFINCISLHTLENIDPSATLLTISHLGSFKTVSADILSAEHLQDASPLLSHWVHIKLRRIFLSSLLSHKLYYSDVPSSPGTAMDFRDGNWFQMLAFLIMIKIKENAVPITRHLHRFPPDVKKVCRKR